jgi:serine phosphatase RsbU (regulator of sigma subunit)
MRLRHDFESHQVSYAGQATCFYLFSDGYPDQFGGAQGRKFMLKKLKELLLEIHSLPMQQQGKILKEAFDDWKSFHKQVDDVLILGFRLVPHQP